MKTNWILLIVAALAFALLMGCAAEEPEVKDEKKEAKVEEVEPEVPAIDPDILPPPRPSVEAAPDLSSARLVVNDDTLSKMASDAVPTDVLDGLAGLQGQEFANADEFAEAVRNTVGENADAYMERIMRNALVMELADQAPAPEGELSIAQREEEQREEPKPKAAVQPEPMAAPEFDIVYFDFDKSNIKPEFRDAIAQNARILLDNPDMRVTIEGHCDERGTNEYNLALGQRRTESVRQALLAEGVPASQLDTISYGEERPVALGHNEDAWSQNRRAVVVIN